MGNPSHYLKVESYDYGKKLADSIRNVDGIDKQILDEIDPEVETKYSHPFDMFTLTKGVFFSLFLHGHVEFYYFGVHFDCKHTRCEPAEKKSLRPFSYSYDILRRGGTSNWWSWASYSKQDHGVSLGPVDKVDSQAV